MISSFDVIRSQGRTRSKDFRYEGNDAGEIILLRDLVPSL